MFGMKSLKTRNFYPDFKNAGFVYGNNTTSPDLVSSLIGTFKSVTRIQDNNFGKPRDIIRISFTREDGEDIYLWSDTKNVFTLKLLGAILNVIGDDNQVELSVGIDEKGYKFPNLRCLKTDRIYKSQVFLQPKTDLFERDMFYLLDNIEKNLKVHSEVFVETATAG